MTTSEKAASAKAGAAIAWTEAMSVGVPELDEDHKGLIRIINQLSANGGDDADPAVVRQCLVALRRYAEVHFGREERVMSICSFPALAHHQEEHRAFVQMMRDESRRFEDDPKGQMGAITGDLVDYLMRWLTHHIMIEDMAYRSFTDHKLTEAREAARSFRHSEVWYSED